MKHNLKKGKSKSKGGRGSTTTRQEESQPSVGEEMERMRKKYNQTYKKRTVMRPEKSALFLEVKIHRFYRKSFTE